MALGQRWRWTSARAMWPLPRFGVQACVSTLRDPALYRGSQIIYPDGTTMAGTRPPLPFHHCITLSGDQAASCAARQCPPADCAVAR